LFLEVVWLQTEMELMYVLPYTLCFHFFTLYVVEVSIIFSSIGTDTFDEKFVDQIYFVNRIIWATFVLKVYIFKILSDLITEASLRNALN
jgi:hypothetical protein